MKGAVWNEVLGEVEMADAESVSVKVGARVFVKEKGAEGIVR